MRSRHRPRLRSPQDLAVHFAHALDGTLPRVRFDTCEAALAEIFAEVRAAQHRQNPIGYRLRDGEFASTLECSSSADFGPDGLADAARVSIAGLGCDVTPIAWAPVLLRAPDGRESRLPRGLRLPSATEG